MIKNKEFELLEFFQVIRKRRWLIMGGTIGCMLVAFTLIWFLPKVYQANAFLKIGKVEGEPLDNLYPVVTWINSTSFQDEVRRKIGLEGSGIRMGRVRTVFAEKEKIGTPAVEVTTIPVLVKIKARANAPEMAVLIAKAASDLVIDKHKLIFEKSITESSTYLKRLDMQIKMVEKGIEELNESIKPLRANPQNNVAALVLLQMQIEQKQAQLFQFIKEYEEVQMRISSPHFSERTYLLIPPVIPENPENFKTMFLVALAGGTGIIIFLILAFFLEYRNRGWSSMKDELGG